MKLTLIILTGTLFLLLVIRFVQPQIIYVFRQFVVSIRLNKLLLEAEERKVWKPQEYKKLLVQDLRPIGVSMGGVPAILARVAKVRELYSVLDMRRASVRTMREAENSQECTVELANMLASVSRALRPSAEYLDLSLKAHDILLLIAERRDRLNGREVTLPDPTDEEQMEAYFKQHPLTLEQLNEIVIAAIYSSVYRLPEGASILRPDS